jgi:hypothetical protein
MAGLSMSMTLQHLKSSLGAHQAYCPSLSMKFQPRKPGFLSLSDFAVSCTWDEVQPKET